MSLASAIIDFLSSSPGSYVRSPGYKYSYKHEPDYSPGPRSASSQASVTTAASGSTGSTLVSSSLNEGLNTNTRINAKEVEPKQQSKPRSRNVVPSSIREGFKRWRARRALNKAEMNAAAEREKRFDRERLEGVAWLTRLGGEQGEEE